MCAVEEWSALSIYIGNKGVKRRGTNEGGVGTEGGNGRETYSGSPNAEHTTAGDTDGHREGDVRPTELNRSKGGPTVSLMMAGTARQGESRNRGH